MMNILITGAGSPATWGTRESLPETDRVIGVDIRPVRTNLDKTYIVPRPSGDFVDMLLNICVEENVEVVIPQVETELIWLARCHDLFKKYGVNVLVSPLASILNARKNSLPAVCSLREIRCLDNCIPVCSAKRGNHDLVFRAAEKVGSPFVVKILDSSGGSGVRFVKETLDYSNFEGKPDGWISYSDLITMLGDKKYRLLISEYFPGAEYSVDVLADRGRMLVCVPRRRDAIRTGITFEGETVEHKEIIGYCKQLTKALELDYVVGFQFREDSEGWPRILECNPRVQGTTVHSTLAGANVIQGAVNLALGRDPGVKQEDVKWGVKMQRYWGAV